MFKPPRIKQIFKGQRLHINKSLGQNFLIDENIRDRIVETCSIKEEDVVLEIGPGLGALTEGISPLCARLTAIEKDKGLSVFLKGLVRGNKKIDIINGDILNFDISNLSKRYKRKIKIIGNLPFYISSPIIFHLFRYKESIDSIFITVQKEVAARIIARAGGKDYGPLSCHVQYYSFPTIRMSILKAAFFPRPKVDASLVELRIRSVPPVNVRDKGLFFKIIKAAFNQRRKTLLNALSNSPFINLDKDLLSSIFDRLGLEYKIRGERLSLYDYAKIEEALFTLGICSGPRED